ncbi:GNAT family N-acetyltransferase [Bacillus sp. Xin]|uniref:GNAT family N-acetyltransferase n=1 Tax=unclassified Bacillus (in: firmicutes) TaxID=185979 RepID=UPI00157336E4|nr:MULTISPECIES: GNAT family N-acetyltransferase [unclassified Bacillus (in: firmicutes)]MBC6973755.1 GNAT family N-acetyltransferase [Bacillus sp. Xin]NSW35978.1 GNAT family N-acetyltransferase [Bacillus sp. Xin1]
MITIKHIDASETYKLRQGILRPNQQLDACKYTSDYETNSFHLGAFLHDELISIASFSSEAEPSLQGNNHYRLRGMATVPAFRKQHAGRSLINHAEIILKERQAELLWCNARITVTDYYKRLEFHEHGEMFDIHPIGLHKLMYKAL